MRYLDLHEVLDLHRRVLELAGGSTGVRDLGGLESALAQPRATFAGQELNPSLAEKAAALCLSITLNHPFVDGNKRVAHAAMETFLVLNGYEIDASVDEQEKMILRLAEGTVSKERLTEWLRDRLVATSP